MSISLLKNMFGPFVKKNWFSGFYCILGKFLKKLTKNWITLLRKLVSEGCKESKSCFAIRNKDVLRTRLIGILIKSYFCTEVTHPILHTTGSPTVDIHLGCHMNQWRSETSNWAVSSGSPTCPTLPREDERSCLTRTIRSRELGGGIDTECSRDSERRHSYHGAI